MSNIHQTLNSPPRPGLSVRVSNASVVKDKIQLPVSDDSIRSFLYNTNQHLFIRPVDLVPHSVAGLKQNELNIVSKHVLVLTTSGGRYVYGQLVSRFAGPCGLQGDMARVQEAYEVHRTNAASKAVSTYLTSLANHTPANPIPRPDEALIAHLKRQTSSSSSGTDDISKQDVNCAVVWARPSTAVLNTLQRVQDRIAGYWGSDFYLIPPSHIHLSVLELSHRHSEAHLRSVLDKVGKERLRSMIELPGQGEQSSFPRLIRPQLMFDAAGVAVSFVPHADDSWSYHHLRADMQKIAKESSIDIDTCYTAATAHVTIGRFIGNGEALVEKVGREKAIGNWLDLVEELNTELKETELIWDVGKEKVLEVQAGYVKFGRGSEMAEQL